MVTDVGKRLVCIGQESLTSDDGSEFVAPLLLNMRSRITFIWPQQRNFYGGECGAECKNFFVPVHFKEKAEVNHKG